MNKIIVIGCPGSGKSTFSRALHAKTDIPLYHLDMMNWNADKTTVPRTIFRQRLLDVLQKNEWIIDGNYNSTIELRLRECDTVFFLDLSPEICLEGIESRKGKKRTDIPWIENENDNNDDFLSFIRNYNSESRPVILELFAKYPNKNIITFTSREAADNYILNL